MSPYRYVKLVPPKPEPEQHDPTPMYVVPFVVLMVMLLAYLMVTFFFTPHPPRRCWTQADAGYVCNPNPED